LGRVGEIETVIQFYRFIPIVQVRRPTHDVVARDATECFFALEESVAFRAWHLAGRTKRRSIFESRQPERRTIFIRPEIKKIIVRIEKFGDVIARSTTATAAKVAIGFDTG